MASVAERVQSAAHRRLAQRDAVFFPEPHADPADNRTTRVERYANALLISICMQWSRGRRDYSL